MSKFPHYLQPDAMDCGPTCLRIVAKHFGRHYNLETLRNLTGKTREGVSLLTISEPVQV
jgi:ATP-binding cassette, subfamily B, bacterial